MSQSNNSRNQLEWVWAVMEKEEQAENLYALEDRDKGIKFIPVFREKEDGWSVLAGLSKKHGARYELEAIRLALVAQSAHSNHLDIYIVDGEGKILERLSPSPEA